MNINNLIVNGLSSYMSNSCRSVTGPQYDSATYLHLQCPILDGNCRVSFMQSDMSVCVSVCKQSSTYSFCSRYAVLDIQSTCYLCMVHQKAFEKKSCKTRWPFVWLHDFSACVSLKGHIIKLTDQIVQALASVDQPIEASWFTPCISHECFYMFTSGKNMWFSPGLNRGPFAC